METPVLKTKTFSFELTDEQLKELDNSLDNILEMSSRFGIFENNLVSEMAMGHAVDNPDLTESVIETLGIVTSTFLALAKNSSVLHNIMLQAMNYRMVGQ